jgi:hypothetical protein
MTFRDPDYELPASYRNKQESDLEPYKGFSIVRRRPHFLYTIESREGFDLPAILSGQFTHLPLIQQAIDTFLRDAGPGASAETAYKKEYKKPKRGRPKKHNEHQSNNQNNIS